MIVPCKPDMAEPLASGVANSRIGVRAQIDQRGGTQMMPPVDLLIEVGDGHEPDLPWQPIRFVDDTAVMVSDNSIEVCGSHEAHSEIGYVQAELWARVVPGNSFISGQPVSCSRVEPDAMRYAMAA